MTTLAAKQVSVSTVESTHLVLPHHTNPQGFIFGGTIMAWIDATAACVAYRHCRTHTVTAGMDNLDFYHPVKLGDIVILKASVNYTGKSSIEVGVRVIAEDPFSGVQTHTSTAYLTFVSIDAAGKPQPVPGLIRETPDQERRWHEAEERKKIRSMGLKTKR